MIYQTVFALCAPDAIMQSYHVYQLLCYKHHIMTPGHLISCNVNLLLRTRGIMGGGVKEVSFQQITNIQRTAFVKFLNFLAWAMAKNQNLGLAQSRTLKSLLTPPTTTLNF